MQYLVRALGIGWALVWLTATAPAVTNVPPGVTVWLQGYDLNPTSPPFRNQGIVKLECIDDSLTIGLIVSGTGMDNAPGGLLLFSSGAGGGRYFTGRLHNDGDVRIHYGTGFVGPATIVENNNQFIITTNANAQVLGPDATFLQRAGRLECGAGFEVWDGRFEYEGGEIDGEPRLVRSHFHLSDTATNAFTVAFFGEDTSFDGSLKTGQVLQVLASPDHGPATVQVDAGSAIGGHLALTSTNTSDTAILQVPDGLPVEPGGRISADFGYGGAREIRGALDLRGELEVETELLLSSTRPLTNQGTIKIWDFGAVTLKTGLKQAGGRIELIGGSLQAPSVSTSPDSLITGFGSILSTVTNGGLIEVDAGTPPLQVVGDFRQTSSGQIQFSLPANPASATAAMRITGSATLDGAVRVLIPGGSEPAVGTRYPLLSAARLSGALRVTDDSPLPPGRQWKLVQSEGLISALVSTGATRVVLEVGVGLEGTPQLRARGTTAANLALEYSPDFRTWTPLDAQLSTTNGVVWVTSLPSTLPKNAVFFRGLVQD